jgi:hypothetical protein
MSAFYSALEMENLLNDNHEYRDMLYRRGFLITTNKCIDIKKYPFYEKWDVTTILNNYILLSAFVNWLFLRAAAFL